MNILIPNSWLKDYLETDATPEQFAKAMSLASVSIERIEKVGDDSVFDIEVTTNRPDLMSVMGIAREASAVLPQQGYKAKFKPREIKLAHKIVERSELLRISSDEKLVNRILAVVLEVEIGDSPKIISDRLTKTGIRSINNIVDVTNYIMREVGHPSHVFDYDRLTDHTLNIRASKKGEKIVTLDDKEYELPGGDIVADNGNGEIIDLLGIMGTANSVVVPTTKRVVLFLDNNNPVILRKSSMNLGIRTEAAILNEKGVDPEIMVPTLLSGIKLLEENAKAKVISPIIDIYPNKVTAKKINVKKEKIDKMMGIIIPSQTIKDILTNLGFGVEENNEIFTVDVPTSRIEDINIPEDIVEEVARVYGYHKLPNILPQFTTQSYYHQSKDEFYWITYIKKAMKFWGFNEVYTYSMVSEGLFEGPIENAVKLKNPLTEDREYLRNSLIPSLVEAANSNKSVENISLFEISNVYIKRKGLPDERLHLAGVISGQNSTFQNGKGCVERILELIGVNKVSFRKREDGVEGADVLFDGNTVGKIEILDEVSFELDLTTLFEFATSVKNYVPPAKYPPVIEDVRVKMPVHYTFQKVSKAIRDASVLVYDVSLLDVFEDKKTFRITFLDRTKNLTNEEIVPSREKIYSTLKEQFKAEIG